MAIFNDPLRCDDPAGDALRMALAMCERMAHLSRAWKRIGHRLGFGVGISLGYATIGVVQSEGRYDYTANGKAVNLAARLCDHAADGEILLSPRAYAAIKDDFEAVAHGEIGFKGTRSAGRGLPSHRTKARRVVRSWLAFRIRDEIRLRRPSALSRTFKAEQIKRLTIS